MPPLPSHVLRSPHGCPIYAIKFVMEIVVSLTAEINPHIFIFLFLVRLASRKHLRNRLVGGGGG